ncbi:MAG: hybrid sensor histidine kinase/response regulator [Alteromonadaceae bacterium]|nr:hybrid sensor histidine kinase/response regulator [Alteromonadaceae bacterium]
MTLSSRTPGMSLSSRLLMLGAFPAVVMFIALMVFFTSARLDDARSELARSGQLLADSLAPALEYAVVSGNKDALDTTLEQSLERSHAAWIRVTDVIGDQLSLVSKDPHPPTSLDGRYKKYSAEILQEPVAIGDGSLLSGNWSGSAGALRVGTVEVAIDLQLLQDRQNQILWSSLAVGAVVLAITLLMVRSFLSNLIGPIRRLARRVLALIEGDYKPHPVAVRGNASEVVEIQQQLNELALHLAEVEQTRDETLAVSDAARNKAEQANQAKSEFLTAMSNELRSPLQGVLGALEATTRDPMTPRQQHYLRTVRQSTEDLLTVISDLLDYAEIDNGFYAPARQAFDLQKLIENCVASFRLTAEQQGAVLELQMPGDWEEGLMVWGDGPRVRQVLASLIENAMTSCSDGFINVRAHLSQLEPGQVLLNCTVVDSGSGLVAARLESEQAGLPATGNMGLVVVQKLVELMGGHVKVGTEETRGSSICFELAFTLAVAETHE